MPHRLHSDLIQRMELPIRFQSRWVGPGGKKTSHREDISTGASTVHQRIHLTLVQQPRFPDRKTPGDERGYNRDQAHHQEYRPTVHRDGGVALIKGAFGDFVLFVDIRRGRARTPALRLTSRRRGAGGFCRRRSGAPRHRRRGERRRGARPGCPGASCESPRRGSRANGRRSGRAA